MNKTMVKVEKETKKACLVSNSNGRKGWIQKRWLGSDSSVSVKTFDNSCKKFEENQAAYEAGRQWLNELHPVEFCRETEKAVAAEASLDFYNVEKNLTKLVWFPKSQIKDGKIPGWLIRCKKRELEEQIEQEGISNRMGGFFIETIGNLDVFKI